MLTDRDFVAWTAGFFDGEGCVMIQGLSSGSLRLGVALGQKVREPLDAVAARWGGTVRVSRESRSNRHATMYDWRLHGRHAVVFLEEVRPFLLVKAAQADVAIAYGATLCRTRNDYGVKGMPAEIVARRLELQAEIRHLNRRGRVA